MRKTISVISIIATVLGGISLLGSETLSMFITQSVPSVWQYVGLALFIFGVGLPTIILQFENFSTSKIYLENYGIQPKKGMTFYKIEKVLFWNKKIRTREEFPAYFIEVVNHVGLGLKNIEKVYPQVFWYDNKGSLVDRNNGRWWLSNPPSYQDTAVLQTVDLAPNGQPRLLYFASFINGVIYSWSRSQDNQEQFRPLQKGEYYVEIKMIANSGQKSTFAFLVTQTNNQIFLERLKGWKKLQKQIKKRKPSLKRTS